MHRHRKSPRTPKSLRPAQAIKPVIDNAKRIPAVKRYVDEHVTDARQATITSGSRTKFENELTCLEKLIPIKAMGFRGVVLTALVGMHLDKDYNPLTNFYGCNPRTLFELGIYDALRSHKVPCGKSDPLNVAKNQLTLDAGWAAGRRPESAALAAVHYITWLVAARASGDGPRYRALERLFFRRLVEFAETQTKLNVDITAETTGPTPLDAAAELVRFVLDCPEGGAVPQFVVGTLIALTRECDQRFRSVEGVTDSVFSTNTTAKKPADVWEVDANDSISSLYEITVKPVDQKRLDDCVESLVQRGVADKVVTFICRCPEDIEGLSLGESRTRLHQGVRFQFVDISNFIETVFIMLPDEARVGFFARLELFVHDVARSERAKLYWANRRRA